MPDSVSVQAAVESAEQAAVAGDFHAAAQHLRDALALQEADLGPEHPDLASTLNNLGVVCERTGNDDEAERCYRRAAAIVTAAFPAEHPFVVTSQQNLAAFCESHHVPLERATATPPKPSSTEPPQLPAPTFRPEPKPTAVPNPPAEATPGLPALGRAPVARFALFRFQTIVVAAIAIALVALWMKRSNLTSNPAPETVTTPAATPALTPTPTPTPSVTSAPAPPPREPAPSRPAAPPTAPEAFSVVDAQLCRALATGGQWTCTHPPDPVDPGPLYFYTRISAARDAVVVHRWYRNDRVELTRELQIRANQTPGYRTYSRLTIDANSAGNWRVEVRTTDGKVLREARFVVK